MCYAELPSIVNILSKLKVRVVHYFKDILLNK